MSLPPGSYDLRLYDAEGNPDGDTEFTVSGPGNLEVADANRDVAALGAVMGGVGPVLILVGAVVMFQNICIDDSECPHANDSRAALGLATMLGGAAMTPIGWVLFAHNRHPHANDRPSLLPYAASTHDRKGGVIGIQGAF